MLRATLLSICLASITIAAPAFAKKPAPIPQPPEPAGASFDRSAAASSLQSVSLLPCKQTNGPTGAGHVIVTFSPNGDANDANVDREPFKNTAVGRCIAQQYKHVRIPKFAGAPISVGTKFRLD